MVTPGRKSLEETGPIRVLQTDALIGSARQRIQTLPHRASIETYRRRGLQILDDGNVDDGEKAIEFEIIHSTATPRTLIQFPVNILLYLEFACQRLSITVSKSAAKLPNPNEI
jgi:hypothetical protein